jgi:hypothetical protein
MATKIINAVPMMFVKMCMNEKSTRMSVKNMTTSSSLPMNCM